MTAGYAPLWCKSHSSFLEGASFPEELIEEAVRLGLPALALTDRNGVYGLPRAHQRGRELGGAVRLLCGAELTVWDSFAEQAPGRGEGAAERLLLLATEPGGWQNLCRLLTWGAQRADKGESVVTVSDVAAHGEGLLAIWGVGPESPLRADNDKLWRARGAVWKEVFGGRCYAALPRHHLAEEKACEQRVVRRGRQLGLPLLAVREVLYHRPERQRLQDVLTCIRHGCSLDDAGTRLKPNSNYALLDARRFRQLYADLPEAVDRTLEVAERCSFSLSQLRYRYPDEPLPDQTTSAQWLRELAWQGAQRRYDATVPAAVAEQLEKELRIISDLDYVGYFLTMYEIVNYCKANDILCQGRGSAANSLVCFCLGITAVDPHKLGLLFERFLSPERAEPPDIDLDIMHQRREEVLAWVYQRYGREHAAMVCNVVRYRPRSAVREIGKVLGIEPSAIERVARLLSGFSPRLDESVLEMVGLPKEAPIHVLWRQLVNEILGFPRHLSIHPGGFLLGSEPLHHLVPVEKASMPGRTVIQWDKYDVESLGLFKVDLLGLGALSHLDHAFRLLKEHRDKDVCMATLPQDDPATYAMLGRGESIGVFQVESRAQMAMLPSMKPKEYYDLVVQVAIVRPGPITGGMVHPYLRRRAGEEPIDYPHPSLQPILQKTLGIPLFQEQVMRLAVVAADYTPGEADQLRRDMAAWSSRGKIEQHRERLIARMMAKGIEEEFAQRVFAQIQGFGEYGFPESHAASFALITYATSWLRCHYPAEFTCALLNSLPMGFYSASTLLEDAKRQQVELRPFCLEQSHWECRLEPATSPTSERPFALRLGFRLLKGLSQATVTKIVTERPFGSVREATVRAGLDRKSLEVLATSGALQRYGGSRRRELWAVDDHLLAKTLPLLGMGQESRRDFAPLSCDEEMLWDYEASGLSTRGHPMRTLRPVLRQEGFLEAAEVARLRHGRWARVVAVVICRQRPATANGTVFLTLEDETGFINVILWKSVFEKYLVVARSAGIIAVEGVIQSGRGVVHLVARKLHRPRLELPVEVGSRDFH